MEEKTNVVNESCEIVKIKELLDEYKTKYGDKALYKLLDDLDGFYGLVTRYEHEKNSYDIKHNTAELNNEQDVKNLIGDNTASDITYGNVSIYESDPKTLESVRDDILSHGTNNTKDAEGKTKTKTMAYYGASTVAPGQTFNN